MNQLDQRRQTIRGFSGDTESLLQGMSDQEIISFLERFKISGEREALQWARNRQAVQPVGPGP